MKRLVVCASIVVAAVIGLSGCVQAEPTPEPATSTAQPASPTNEPVIPPVVEDVGDLQGATVDLVVGQVLSINTGDLAVDSYSGEIEDPTVAEFTKGHDDGSAQFNPGVTALAEGTTQVVLSNEQGGIQDVTFTVNVTAG